MRSRHNVACAGSPPLLLPLLLLLAGNAEAAAPGHVPPGVPGWLNLHGHTLLTPEFDASRKFELTAHAVVPYC